MAHKFVAELDVATLMEGVALGKAGDKVGAGLCFMWVGGCGLMLKKGKPAPTPVGAAVSASEAQAVTAMSDDALLAAIEAEAPAKNAVAAGPGGFASGMLMKLLQEWIVRFFEKMDGTPA